jgi:hypothetical protein
MGNSSSKNSNSDNAKSAAPDNKSTNHTFNSDSNSFIISQQPYPSDDKFSIVSYKSEGDYVFTLSKEQFLSIIRVNQNESLAGFSLEWIKNDKGKNNKARILEGFLMEHPMFMDHYRPLWQQQKCVAARFSINSKTNNSSTQRPCKTPCGFAIYAKALCIHHAHNRHQRESFKNACSSSMVLGFHEDQIRDLINNIHNTIQMNVHVSGDCTHIQSTGHSTIQPLNQRSPPRDRKRKVKFKEVDIPSSAMMDIPASASAMSGNSDEKN